MKDFNYISSMNTTTVGRWTVHGVTNGRIKVRDTYHCVCVCGNEKDVIGRSLRSGESQSCGCLRNERVAASCRKRAKHNHTANGVSTPTYRCWSNMINRCKYESMDKYPRYGGRGIKVCDRWQDFRNFLEDMGEKPPGYHIDRIDNDGNYEPGNCRWATILESANNKECSVYINWKGETKTVSQWAREERMSTSRFIYERFKEAYEVKEV